MTWSKLCSSSLRVKAFPLLKRCPLTLTGKSLLFSKGVWIAYHIGAWGAIPNHSVSLLNTNIVLNLALQIRQTHLTRVSFATLRLYPRWWNQVPKLSGSYYFLACALFGWLYGVLCIVYMCKWHFCSSLIALLTGASIIIDTRRLTKRLERLEAKSSSVSF